MDTKGCKKNALEEVRRTIARRNANILKGQVSDGAIGNPIYRIDIMEEIRALTSIKKMGSGTLSKVMQSGTVNIRSGIKDNTKSSRNRGTGRCRKAHKPSIKSLVFTASGNMVGSNSNVVKQLMSGSGSQSIKLPAFEGGWIDCGNPKGSKRKYFKSLHFLKNSWVVVEGKRYYLGSDEYMVTGWKKIYGHYYYFESNIRNGKETAGYMATYWHEIKGKRYYFGSNGERVTSKVIDWNGKKYYVEKNGVMAINKTILDSASGKTYKADEKGVLTEGTGNAITSIKQAYSVMTDYINGNTVTDALLDEAIDYTSNYGLQTQVKSLSSLNDSSHNYNRYDNLILGWANYWNDALKGTKNFGIIDANVVKALIYTETKMGYYSGSTSANGSIDVMQVLDGRNPAVQRLAACGNYDPNEGAAYGLPRQGYGALMALYPNGIYNKSATTVIMSIAFGIRWFEYKVALKGNLNDGINAYNVGDPNYWNKVDSTLKIMK